MRSHNLHSRQLPHARPAGWRWWGRAAAFLPCALLGGCAVGSVGALAANIERRDTVAVMSVYSVGLHARTRTEDPGVHLGYSKRVYVFAADDSIMPGWHFLNVPSPASSAFALDSLTIGLDVSLAAPQAGISLGQTHTRLHARMPSDACVLIEYLGPDVRIDKHRACAEDSRCAHH